MIFLEIGWNIVLPIFMLMGIGFALDRVFNLDVRTLTRVSFYVILPALLFHVTYSAEIRLVELAGLAGFIVVFLLILGVVSYGVFSLPRLREYRAPLVMASLYINAANYGIPLMELAFGPEAVIVTGTMIMVASGLLITGMVLLYSSDAEQGVLHSLINLIKMPVVWGIALGFLFRGFGLTLPGPFAVVIDRLQVSVVAIGLIMLGAQLSKTDFTGEMRPVYAVMAMRFIAGPLVAAGLLLIFPFEPPFNQALIVAAAMPAAVNNYVLAAEFDQSPDLVSRVVFWTTLGSIIAIPIVLALVQ